MEWYFGVAGTAFVAGLGWQAASFLWALLEAFIIDDEDE